MIGRHYLLTVAVGVSREHIVNGYDIPEISRYVIFSISSSVSVVGGLELCEYSLRYRNTLIGDDTS